MSYVSGKGLRWKTTMVPGFGADSRMPSVAGDEVPGLWGKPSVVMGGPPVISREVALPLYPKEESNAHHDRGDGAPVGRGGGN